MKNDNKLHPVSVRLDDESYAALKEKRQALSLKSYSDTIRSVLCSRSNQITKPLIELLSSIHKEDIRSMEKVKNLFPEDTELHQQMQEYLSKKQVFIASVLRRSLTNGNTKGMCNEKFQ